MEQVDLTSFPEVVEVLQEYVSDEEILKVRGLLGVGRVYYYNAVVVLFIPSDSGVMTQHLYKGSESLLSGKELKDFVIECNLDTFRSLEDTEVIMNIVKYKDTHIRYFMRNFPYIKKISSFTNGDTMWMVFRKDIKEVD